MHYRTTYQKNIILTILLNDFLKTFFGSLWTETLIIIMEYQYYLTSPQHGKMQSVVIVLSNHKVLIREFFAHS